MASALKPGVLLHHDQLVFLIDGKRARHAYKLFINSKSVISSIPDIVEGEIFVFDPYKALSNQRSSSVYVVKDDNVRMLTDRLPKDAIAGFQGDFLLGYYKDSPGLVFRTVESFQSFVKSAVIPMGSQSPTVASSACVLFLPISGLLEHSWEEKLPIEDAKVTEISFYGVVQNSVPSSQIKHATAVDIHRQKKPELVSLAQTLASCSGQRNSSNKKSLLSFIDARLSFLKLLRVNFRWESDGIFWNMPVWWRCEIAYKHPEAPKKLSELVYGVDYFFDIFHLTEVIMLNPEFALHKHSIEISILKDVAKKYEQNDYAAIGDKMDLPSRIFQIATTLHNPNRVFDESYFQEMLIDDGWDVFEVVSDGKRSRKSLKQDIYFIPPEYKRRRKVSQENFEEFTADIDYFTNRKLVVQYVLNHYGKNSKWQPSNDSSTVDTSQGQTQVQEDTAFDSNDISSTAASLVSPSAASTSSTTKTTTKQAPSSSQSISAQLPTPIETKSTKDSGGAVSGMAAKNAQSSVVTSDSWTGPAPEKAAPMTILTPMQKPGSLSAKLTQRSNDDSSLLGSPVVKIDRTPAINKDEADAARKMIGHAKSVSSSQSKSGSSKVGSQEKTSSQPGTGLAAADAMDVDDPPQYDEDDEEDDVIYFEDDDQPTENNTNESVASSRAPVAASTTVSTVTGSSSDKLNLSNKREPVQIPHQVHPVVAPKLFRYITSQPGVEIIRVHEWDRIDHPVLMYLVDYPVEKISDMPIPVGCDPKYVTNVPGKTAANESQLMVANVQQTPVVSENQLVATNIEPSIGSANQEKSEVVETESTIGVKRPASVRNAALKRGKVSKDDSRYPSNEEHNGYIIY